MENLKEEIKKARRDWFIGDKRYSPLEINFNLAKKALSLHSVWNRAIKQAMSYARIGIFNYLLQMEVDNNRNITCYYLHNDRKIPFFKGKTKMEPWTIYMKGQGLEDSDLDWIAKDMILSDLVLGSNYSSVLNNAVFELNEIQDYHNVMCGDQTMYCRVFVGKEFSEKETKKKRVIPFDTPTFKLWSVDDALRQYSVMSSGDIALGIAHGLLTSDNILIIKE